MKKLIALLLALAMVLSLAACGNTASAPADQSSPAKEAPASTPVAPAPKEDVKITLPAELVELMEEDDGDSSSDSDSSFLDVSKSDSVLDAVKNSDGSITYTIDGEKYDDMLSEYKTTICDALSEIATSGETPSIKAVTATDDMKKVTMTVDYAAYSNSFDSLMILAPVMYLDVYHIIAGVSQDDIRFDIDIVDEASGEIKDSCTYPDDFEGDSEEEPESAAETFEMEGDSGESHVEIKGASFAKDMEGKKCLVVTYDWTNNSEETTSAGAALLSKAFQNGVELDMAYVDWAEEDDNEFRDVRPGVTLTVKAAFALTDESEVEYEIFDWVSPNANKVTAVFDLSKLS